MVIENIPKVVKNELNEDIGIIDSIIESKGELVVHIKIYDKNITDLIIKGKYIPCGKIIIKDKV